MLWSLWLGLACVREVGKTTPDESKAEDVPPIVPGEPIACEDPGAREEQAFDFTEPGSDWANVYFGSVGGDSLPQVDSGGVAMVDLNGDERLDFVFPSRDGMQIYLAMADGTWVDRSEDLLPPGYRNNSTAVLAVDMDGDGAQDLFYCSMPGNNELLYNNGQGNFEERFSERVLFTSSVRSCKGAGFGDIDGDLDLDLVIASQQPCNDPEMSCLDPENGYAEFLYLNNGDGTFTDVSDRMPMEDLVVSDMHNVALLDLDADGDLDLYIVNDHKIDAPILAGNLAYLNDGTGHFARMPAGNGLELNMAGMGLGVGDFNGDQRPELLVSGSTMMAMLVSGPENTWYDASTALGLRVYTPRKSAWGNQLLDIDNDTDLDALVLFGWTPTDVETENLEEQPDALWIQGDGWRYREESASWGLDSVGVGRGIAVGDINADGWLDYVARDLYGLPRMYLSRCGEASWIRVRLRDEGPNTAAIGARVVIEAGGITQTHWVMGGGKGLYGTFPTEAHFGLADAEVVDSIRVTWPNGDTTELNNVAARELLVIDHD